MVEIVAGPASVAVILQSRAHAELEITSAPGPADDGNTLTLDTYTRQIAVELDADDRIFAKPGSVFSTTLVVIKKS